MAAIASRMGWISVVVGLLVLLAGCGESDDSGQAGDQAPPQESATAGAGSEHQHMGGSPVAGEPGDAMQVFLVASQLVVGQNRFAVGLTTPDNALIDDADVTFEYFDLSNPAAPVSESKAEATRLSSTDGLTVIYAQERSFDRAGAWGVLIDATRPDGTTLSRNISFDVLADSPTLAIGEKAPAIDSPTSADVDGDLTKLTSASKPNPAFYEMTIADALADGKPTVVLFATPSYCQTRFCGPDYDIVSDIQQRYGAQFNAIHVEVYSGLPNPAASGWQYNQPLIDFGVQTEPWLFVINAAGVVTWRVEGLFTEDEVVAALRDVGVTG
ncbi:MAG TPA: thioredoxin family protein [Thermomicrobiales bacterium]|nr:thioredoxin family protein [Thermomicrobiales bacterium]